MFWLLTVGEPVVPRDSHQERREPILSGGLANVPILHAKAIAGGSLSKQS
jgi:hypothetical protein